jgi:release factor glutamine methyltransferase
MLATLDTQVVDFLGRRFVIPPTVHPINPMSDLIGSSILAEVKESDRVLDMGTGCGVNAILAASKSAHVFATDINPSHSMQQEEMRKRMALPIALRLSKAKSSI